MVHRHIASKMRALATPTQCAQHAPVASCKPAAPPVATQHPTELPRRAALALVVTSTVALNNPAALSADLPGFKKDLSNKRKLKIPEDDYSDGPDGLKFFDVVVGTGSTC